MYCLQTFFILFANHSFLVAAFYKRNFRLTIAFINGGTEMFFFMMKDNPAFGAAVILQFVFVYTAASKLFTLQAFEFTLAKMPLIGQGAHLAAWLVPLTELHLVLLLCFRKTRVYGLWASLGLLGLFTFYLLYTILFVGNLPCGCGGVVDALDWRSHIVFNLLLMGTTVMGIRNGHRVSG